MKLVEVPITVETARSLYDEPIHLEVTAAGAFQRKGHATAVIRWPSTPQTRP